MFSNDVFPPHIYDPSRFTDSFAFISSPRGSCITPNWQVVATDGNLYMKIYV